MNDVNIVSPNVFLAYMGFLPIYLDMILCKLRFSKYFP